MGFFEKKLKIKVLYRNKWYYASEVSIDIDGKLYIENCHDLFGCLDSEHVDDIKIEEVQEK